MTDLLRRFEAAVSDRYRLERELGRGGMAIVCLAEDLKHRRRVAVKVLKPEISHALGSERFLREIEIAAQLSHPNILPLYDSGAADGLLYYVMPYVDGESLRGRLDRERQLPINDALQVTREVAGALAYAHSNGLVHRDIKPENVLFQSGHAVVSDFGIARAVGKAGGDRLTETGLALGTPTYMSPEQASGEHEIDARTDIYSLGCLLYEMLAGTPPYTGANAQAILARKVVEPLPPLRVVRDTVPVRIEQVIAKALAKAPADRFATATEFSAALDQALTSGRVSFAVPRLSARRRAAALAAVFAIVLVGGGWWLSRNVLADSGRVGSLVVLPFDNLSRDTAQEYFVAGMHDALIGELAQIGSLRVISRRSAARYRNTEKSAQDIARELNVNGIVEGSVHRAGNTLRVQVQLVQALPAERHLWAHAYDREVRDVMSLYSDMARAIATEIRARVTTQEQQRLASVRRVNPESYEAYLRGKFYLSRSGREAANQGLSLFHQAVERDPTDPLAYAGLAQAYTRVAHSAAGTAEHLTRAKAAASRALELDETVADAHSALAQIKLYKDWDWPGADRAFRRALDLDPTLAATRAHYAWYLLLMGDADEAITEAKRAAESDPLAPLWGSWLAWLYMGESRYDDAINEARKALELNPIFPDALCALGTGLLLKGMRQEALATHEKLASVREGRLCLARTYAVLGRSNEARQIAAEYEKLPPTNANTWGLAAVYAALGEKDGALRTLEEGFELRFNFMPWILWNPDYVPLRDEPRFQALVRRLKLPASALRGFQPS
jgi:TolB-like protein/tRNA A-37 threonylcarbamoyl transferase component Bud32/Tfp pilus assembly protein PilF